MLTANAHRVNYVVVREDLHSSTKSIVASFGDSYKRASEYATRCSEVAERDALPYLYTIE